MDRYMKTLDMINTGQNPVRVHDALIDDAKVEVNRVFDGAGCTTIVLNEMFHCETNGYYIYAVSKGDKDNLNWWYSEDNGESSAFYDTDEDMENHDGGCIDGHDILGIDVIRIASAYIKQKDFTTK